MAGFERYYGAQTYSPKTISGDASLISAKKIQVNSVDKLNVKNVLNANSYQSKTLIDAEYAKDVIKFAEAIPYVQLSHSLDSVRSYGWEAHFSNDLIEAPVRTYRVSTRQGLAGRALIDEPPGQTIPVDQSPNQRPLTLAVKSFSGLRFTTQASPIGIIGIGPTGQFTLTTPQPGTFTMAFDDLLDVNIGVRLFNMFKPQKTFNLNLYKFDGNKTLKTHFFMKDVVVTSIKQSDLNYSNTREFSSYEVEFMVQRPNFYISGQYIDNNKPDQLTVPANSEPID